MKKHLPNLLLLFIVLVNIYFMTRYIKNNGLGQFLSTTGIIFLIIGLIIFIFFISIDPGYGWTKSIDLTRNCIMIFVSMAVGIVGVVLIIVGQHIHEIRIDTLHKQARCKDIIAGRAQNVLRDEWYSLRDQKKTTQVVAYLFQSKSNRHNYKIIITLQDTNSMQNIDKLIISSSLLKDSITVERYQPGCPGVFEQDISIDYQKHQKVNGKVTFGLNVLVKEKWFADEESPTRRKNVRLILKNTPQGDAMKSGSGTRVIKPYFGNRTVPLYVSL